MEKYSSNRGSSQSGVTEYEIGEDYILLRYSRRKLHKYTAATCGEIHFRALIERAKGQLSLNSYIQQYHPEYERIRQ